MSGGPGITGWIINLFPYLSTSHDKKLVKNEHCWKSSSWKEAMGENGLDTTELKYWLHEVPFTFAYNNDERVQMNFIGGLFGVCVTDKDNALLPTFGYAITEKKAK